ncbi:Ubiquinol-cytochrome-c reductase complex assembly factor 1 [Eumeta japonica]|uniref:Ubiquinol-cytochrome-c reductase complex assembly factor 1 n=1 Tax=Eumeta variegata TaxID=151549 RepID=A0A4C1XEE9_EUMVA|nr:Ubiquinol-cytochrome-c reductase complex assembly factor 1 [Eumeta japonica]
MVRCMAEDLITSNKDKKSAIGTEKTYVKGSGLFIRNCVIEALWADVANRIKFLEGANITTARKQVSELSEQFQAALIGYDEGLEDDRALAGAVWRRFYAMSPTVTAMQVESIVSYTRHQMSVLEKISKDELMSQPSISWLSISDHLVTKTTL